MTVVTRLEVHRMKLAIQEIDPKAFFYVQTIKEVKGGVVKQVGKKARMIDFEKIKQQIHHDILDQLPEYLTYHNPCPYGICNRKVSISG